MTGRLGPRDWDQAMCREESGFTLLEVLAALVVLGLLMVGLAEGVRTQIALSQAQTRRLAETADLDATMRLLRGLLSRLPVTAEGNRVIATGTGAGFKGEADHVEFVGKLATGLGFGRLVEAVLYVRNHRLILSWRPHRHDKPLGPLPPPSERELLHGVERLELWYWGAAAAGQPGIWQTRWDRPEAPELIKLRLVFIAGDRRHWPDLVTAAR